MNTSQVLDQLSAYWGLSVTSDEYFQRLGLACNKSINHDAVVHRTVAHLLACKPKFSGDDTPLAMRTWIKRIKEYEEVKALVCGNNVSRAKEVYVGCAHWWSEVEFLNDLESWRAEVEKKIEASVRDSASRAAYIQNLRSSIITMLEFERAEIEALISQRSIKSLVHFTDVSNLESIFKSGLLPRSVLDEKKIPYAFNDSLRIDNLIEAICLSVEFPNYKMLYSHRQSKGRNLCLLELDPCILGQLPCLFSPTNAASNGGLESHQFPRRWLGVPALEGMFVDQLEPPFNRDALGLPNSFATDPQAEILVLDVIPKEFIRGVAFAQASVTHDGKRLAELYGISDISQLRRDWYGPRVDYQVWPSRRL